MAHRQCCWSVLSQSSYPSHINLQFYAVFNKLVTTALKYTPIIAAHHMPYKTLANGKLYVPPLKLDHFINRVNCSKPPASTPKTASLTKLLLAHIQTAIHLIGQLPSNPVSHTAAKKQKQALESEDESDSDSDDGRAKRKGKGKGKKGKGGKGKGTGEDGGEEDEGKTALVELALAETGKLAPYIVGSRKAVRAWLKVSWLYGSGYRNLTPLLDVLGSLVQRCRQRPY